MKRIFATYLIVVMVGIFLNSCTSNTMYKKPDDLISKRKMVAILTDIYIAESATTFKNKQQYKGLDYMPLVYKKYGIDSARFARSNRYYMSKIDTYEELNQKVSENIDEMLKERTIDKDTSNLSPAVLRKK